MFVGRRTLIDLENELLRLLNETRGSLLEDAELFNTLQTSKATSIAVQKSLEISETTEVAIDTAREVLYYCFNYESSCLSEYFRDIVLVLKELQFCFSF